MNCEGLYHYTTSCVALVKREDVDELGRMTESGKEVTVRTFRKRTESLWLETLMGYVRHGRGLALSKDWAVRFFKGKWHGRTCYYMVHSRIEYIFAERKPK